MIYMYVLMTMECRSSLFSVFLAVVKTFDFALALMLKLLAFVFAGIQHGICTDIIRANRAPRYKIFSLMI